MIKLNNIELIPGYDEFEIKSVVAKALKIDKKHITDIRFAKKSIDARKKERIHFICAFYVQTDLVDEQGWIDTKKIKNASLYTERTPEVIIPVSKPMHCPIVVGAGPAGLFAALTLARGGFAPIIIERGETIDKRVKSVDRFFRDRLLNTDSNVQFGEGGAGTFSDGKLNTGIKDERIGAVLQTFVDCGAPDEILYLQKPHIGTDFLCKVIVRLREKIIELGGEFHFQTKLERINYTLSGIQSITVSTNGSMMDMPCNELILAIGHSARDTFEMLHSLQLPLTQKPFAMGVRIEHKQQLINRAQYGNAVLSHLPVADYKLAVHLSSGRGVYTFCMCPGGSVVAAASENGMVAVNGMSNHDRAAENANSAVLVGVDTSDFGSEHPLAGIAMQRKIEIAAFSAAGSNYNAPAQFVGGFLYGDNSFHGSVSPSYRPDITYCDIGSVFPKFITDSLKEGIMLMDKRLHGFADKNAVLTAPETRSSSPVRILRNTQLQSDISGIYPCGEGAGYAGGITSAAVDGIKAGEAILKKYL